MKTKTTLFIFLTGIALITGCKKNMPSPKITSSSGGSTASGKNNCVTIRDEVTGYPIEGVKVKYTLIGDDGSGWHMPYKTDSAFTDALGKLCVTMPQNDAFYLLTFSKKGYVKNTISSPTSNEFKLSPTGFLKLHVLKTSSVTTFSNITFVVVDSATPPQFFSIIGTFADTTFVSELAPRPTTINWYVNSWYIMSNISINSKDTTKVEINI